MISQSFLNGSINESTQYSSFGYVRCDIFMNEIDDIMNSNAMYIPKINHYYSYDRKGFNKYHLITKYNEINKIKTNIVNNKMQYVILNLPSVILLYEKIWVILAILWLSLVQNIFIVIVILYLMIITNKL